MTDPTPIDGPRIRRAPIPPEVEVVVRGDAGRDADRTQAERFLRRYPSWGRYGLSAFYVHNEGEIEDLVATQLQRFARLGLFRIADLVARGFEVVPTFRTPHITIAFSGDLESRLKDLESARLELRPNPYHGEEQALSLVENAEEER